MRHSVVVLISAVVAAGCGASSKESTPSPAPTPSFVDTLPQPSPLANTSSAARTVEVQLVAEGTTLAVAPGKPASHLFAYNGSIPGPTLEATEGDHVVVHFTNKLSEPTTVHWHGMHVPADQDGSPMNPVAPGASRDYVFDLPPGSAGTYWYHPHTEGKTAEQVAMGLYGAVIVRAAQDPVPAEYVDEILMLNDNRFEANGELSADDMNDQMNGRIGDVIFANGAVLPTMTLRPGETRRLRILNASAARYYLLAVPGHTLVQIGTSALFGAPRPQEQLLLAPAERAEVLLQANGEPGTATTLRAMPYDRGLMSMSGGAMPMDGAMDLLSIAYTSDARMTMAPIPATLRVIAPLDTTGATERSFVLSEDKQMMGFMINGKVYDPARVDVRAKLGATEIWTVRNDADMDHPFHLHGFQFQLLDRNGQPEPVVAWRDTFNVSAKESVRFAVKLDDFPGLRMFHCHILEHEGLGMMGTLSVE